MERFRGFVARIGSASFNIAFYWIAALAAIGIALALRRTMDDGSNKTDPEFVQEIREMKKIGIWGFFSSVSILLGGIEYVAFGHLSILGFGMVMYISGLYAWQALRARF